MVLLKTKRTILLAVVFASLFGGYWLLAPSGANRSQPGQVEQTGTAQAIPDVIDFNFHVKPILSDRCFKCHGPDEKVREGGLALHDKAFAFAALGENKDRYAIIPGDPENSTLIQRIFAENEDDQMPPPESNLLLSDQEKAILKKWIEQGAEWKPHWAFIPPESPPVPEVKDADWPRNEIDHFILARLESMHLAPSARETKEKLIRRVSFDLTGLPPSLKEIDDFLKDNSPEAFGKVVDRLLASDAYAERMALEWMDLARYADTHGYQDDFERIMWPWRDWVIHAYKENMPYDEFVTWQLAGDLLPDATLEQVVATGFNRNHKITAEGGVIDEEYRTEYVADRAQTFATAFLGLTMECARCHDHKYDPISQKDYYSLFSFFNNIPEKGLMENPSIIPEPYITLTQEQIEKTAQFINNLDSMPAIPLMVMQEMKTPRKAFILRRGQYDQPGEEVRPATPASILPMGENRRKDRLGLAEWLFDKGNPLTARVAVNRLWQQLFGNGIVSTSFDFGNQGALPTHPELLDFLAVRYREEGWDTKAMLKYMVLSSTYQQSAAVSEELLEADPENRWLARAPRRRLEAEMIRDQALKVSGLLNREVGGPSVKPYQPAGIWEETTGGGGGSTARYVQDTGDKLYRRSLYTFWKRTVPPPSMMTFDTPSRDLCTVKRQETNTPLQALVLLNDPQSVEAARMLAHQAIDHAGAETKERIAYMFRLATSRAPEKEELEFLVQYFEEEELKFTDRPEAAEKYLQVGEFILQTEMPGAELAAYALVANAILNLDEAITRG
ncbi:MAG: PSD1 domain-containing protein [Phaeodactylibacter sp.]|nr:PSD1 domain-containing protein [Phaeodactylibacter sp.]